MNKPKVFFLPWEARDRLDELMDRSGMASILHEGDLVAVKIHFGERGNDGYIKPNLVRPVLDFIHRQGAKSFLTDTCTIYHGMRSTAVGHLSVAAEHGFSYEKMRTPVIIADGLKGDDFEEVEINGNHFKGVKIASAVIQSNAIIALTHFKGHLLSGFGGVIKNLGMGCGARLGKFEMHSSVAPTISAGKCTGCGACVDVCAQGAISLVDGKAIIDTNICAGCGECVVTCDFLAISVTWNKETADVQERFVEYAIGAVKDKRAFYINFVNHITPNCDCMSKKEEPLLDDIGILASIDPVAIDKASLDLVIKAGGDVFAKAHPNVDYNVQLVHAQKLGLGKVEYELINV